MSRRDHYKTLVKEVLSARDGFEFMSSAVDILQMKYRDVEFDLVLVGPLSATNDARANNLALGVESVLKLKEDVKCENWVFEVIRACKYWGKRQATEGKLKSVLIELIVLDLWKSTAGSSGNVVDKRIELFMRFLKCLKEKSSKIKDAVFQECAAELEEYSKLVAAESI